MKTCLRAVSYTHLSTAAVVMDFKRGGKGVAVGKVAEDEYVFEVSEDWDCLLYTSRCV